MLKQTRLEVSVYSQLVGECIADDGHMIARPNRRLGERECGRQAEEKKRCRGGRFVSCFGG